MLMPGPDDGLAFYIRGVAGICLIYFAKMLPTCFKEIVEVNTGNKYFYTLI